MVKQNIPMKKQTKTNEADTKSLEDFLKDLRKITQTGKEVIDIVSDINNMKETLEAEEVLDDLEVKPFGDSGAHITIPTKYRGKKAKVIIKK